MQFKVKGQTFKIASFYETNFMLPDQIYPYGKCNKTNKKSIIFIHVFLYNTRIGCGFVAVVTNMYK